MVELDRVFNVSPHACDPAFQSPEHLQLCLYLRTTSSPIPSILRLDGEKSYLDPSTSQVSPLPSIKDPPTKDLTVVIPAYNEESRLPIMLEECLEYLESRKKSGLDYEVLIVDDGSRDGTTRVGLQYSKKYTPEYVRVLTLQKNRGKGGAVRLGMLSGRGRLLLLADADGATEFKEYSKLEKSVAKVFGLYKFYKAAVRRRLIESPNVVVHLDEEIHVVQAMIFMNPKVIAIGSRAHLEKESIAQRSPFRNLLMYGFHAMVWIFGVRGIKDTQCGFKLFAREAASRLFSALHVERWAFDVELLYMAKELGYQVEEVAVRWTEIEGSKLVPIYSWLEMAKDLILLRLRYVIGAWKILDKEKHH
ncbi:ALG5 [Cordylochernes scorpioides]|uniref:dolichyl-phosphate beta-glucosyltransferase n=1 Tax=Cordylochernes scorpioides TaxID=51811 RepID=A0ABY6L0L9_9ARAC|nr:ALG5 [Cordylochernes scorpioides]